MGGERGLSHTRCPDGNQERPSENKEKMISPMFNPRKQDVSTNLGMNTAAWIENEAMSAEFSRGGEKEVGGEKGKIGGRSPISQGTLRMNLVLGISVLRGVCTHLRRGQLSLVPFRVSGLQTTQTRSRGSPGHRQNLDLGRCQATGRRRDVVAGEDIA
ncbi:hypothetical protein BO99DRAFT_172510 [Aspergillus violaceofuscus CBS 115571]|uniref:Uncharacterized protein n=1 Tax=Aspergillus violaceofuscus (strain CBS 115571) TaxID=1450538 RepID=A0A2V5H2G4_ASPV1|nr:hypothetical protein BO99DRAFT_172510 [Aspergillus violaceofuscus CBS 115571]